jgi:hypothetical protein
MLSDVTKLPRLRTLLALATALAASALLAGCVAFTGPITITQQDVIGKERVTFTICASNHPDGAGGNPDHPGCDEPVNGDAQVSNGSYQVLLGFRVPAGTTPPSSFSASSGESLTFARSASYEQQLQTFVPAPAGQTWVGYLSNVYSYNAGADNDPAKKASFSLDFGLPPGSDGKPFAGPFTIRPVVGGRDANGSPGGDGDPARPVGCGDTVFGGGSDINSANTDCIDNPDQATTATNLTGATRDLGIAGAQVAANPGKRVSVPFTARYAGNADPAARFTLSAQSLFRDTTVTPSTGVLVPGTNSTSQLSASLTVPKRAAAGQYLVALVATLPNGLKRTGIGVIRVRDKLAPVVRGLAVVPSSFTPFPDRSSISASRGARVTYRLSEAATMRFTVQRRVRGRYRRVKGSFRHKGKKGANRFHFTGFVRRRALRPGAYRLVGVPVDKAKNKGRAVRTRFRIRR